MLRCPTTGMLIRANPDEQWTRTLSISTYGAHYTWFGFSYILVKDLACHIDWVEVYVEGTNQLVGKAFRADQFILATHV